MQSNAKQCKAHAEAMQCKAKQSHAKQCKGMQNKTKQSHAKQCKAMQKHSKRHATLLNKKEIPNWGHAGFMFYYT
jgi:hypothetical protein